MAARALPGFRLSLAITLGYAGIVVGAPMLALFARASTTSWDDVTRTVGDPRALSALQLSLTTSLAAALACGVLGFLLAWVLARYEFPGKGLLDAIVDLPVALPTLVVGLTLTNLFGPTGLLGEKLARLGIRVAFSFPGIALAMTFVSFPLVVRAVEPVLRSMSRDLEEASAVLGASRLQTFRMVSLPCVLPALLTGMTMAFGRALGEYGSIVFISGNLPMKTEIVPLLIVTKLESHDYAGATVLAAAMLVVSAGLLFATNLLAARTARLGKVQA